VRIVIAGCGRVGSDLALSLSDSGHDVSVVDVDAEAFRRLGSAFNGTTHEGQAYDIQVMRDAGIEFADAFAAVTSFDNVNLMAVQVANQVFGVPKTVARLDDPRRTDAYRALNIKHVTAGKLISRAVREQILEGEYQSHLAFLGENVELMEMLMSADADGISVHELEIRGRLRVAAVRRGLEVMVATRRMILNEDDIVIAAAEEGVRRKVSRYCKGTEL
jgi:trk system potassium uptake protein TrkA